MKFVTFGTKVMDDAIASSKHENKLRITRVSPFVLSTASCLHDDGVKFDEMKQVSPYLARMLSFQLNNSLRELIKDLKTDFLCLDFLDAWKPMSEYIFSDNTKIRITQSEIWDKYEKAIIMKLEGVHGRLVTESLIEPLKWNDAELEYEMNMFIDWLDSARNADSGQILILEAFMPFQKIQNNKVVFWNSATEIASKNNLTEKCIALLNLREKKCVTIPKVDIFVGSEKSSEKEMYNYFPEYYSFILECIESKFEQAKIRQINLTYMRKIQHRIDRTVFSDIIKQYQQKGESRSVILFGNTDLLEEYPEFGKYVQEVIPYFYQMPWEINLAECLQNKSEEYVLIFPHIFAQDEILKKMFKLGYCYPFDIITPQHDPIVLSQFKGNYNDVYHNFVTVKKAITLHLRGNGAFASVGCGEMPNYQISAMMYEQSEMILEDNIRPDKLNVGLNPGGRLFIGKSTTFADNCKIGIPKFSTVVIGRDCMFSSKIFINAGDGHNIYNVEAGECINFTEELIDTEKTTVRLGGHVWIGYEVVLLAGTDIGSGCIVGTRAVVKGKFPNNSIIVGSPARVVKKDIGWAREPFVTDIYADSSNVDHEFLQKTVEGEI